MPAPQAPIVKVGDPTRWGARTTVLMPSVGATPATAVVKQVVLTQTTDRYSRPWVLAGAVVMEQNDWERSLAPGSFDLDVFLDISMGVGQSILTQRMSTKALVQVATGTYTPAPGALDPGVYRAQTEGDRMSYPFYAAGIVGQSVAVGATIFVFTPNLVVNPRVDITLMISPYNAGTGL